ncbi:DUF2325 domain-containing protein [Geobacillus subterraneus]|nr:DUF2325 domain-containing protein [Geobacillus subterraneus]
MEDQMHPIRPLQCSKCGYSFQPESLLYYEELQKQVITEAKIAYGSEFLGEEALAREEGHWRRKEVFQERENEFWEEYGAYASTRWKEILQELNEFEFRDAYAALGLEASFKSVAQYRKDVLSRFDSLAERMRFWRAANHYFIYEHLLEGGFFGLDVERTAKDFGRLRTRFVVFHLPMDESLELVRAEWIGHFVKKGKEEQHFLLRQISVLTDELSRLKQKNLSLVRRIEAMKADVAELEKKLAASYQTIEQMKQERREAPRNPDDVRKIRELKQWVSELIEEIKRLRPQQEEEVVEQAEHLVEEWTDDSPSQREEEEALLNVLKGKVVGIIGGDRKAETTSSYPCHVLFHHGRTRNPDFERVLKDSDILVVLTQFVSHITMWETKAYAFEHEKPIYFLKGLNLRKLLTEVAKLEQQEKNLLRQE